MVLHGGTDSEARARQSALPAAHNVAQLFSRQARRTPQACALRYHREQRSYQVLEQRAHQLARFLQRRAVQAGEVVGVWMAPSFDWVEAVWAVWQVGAVYLPLDPSYPTARLHAMLADAGVRTVITQAPFALQLMGQVERIVYTDAERQQIEAESADAWPDTAPPTGDEGASPLAYLLYTSGSTGVPKGVMVSHRALLNKLTRSGTWGDVTPDCRAALLSSIGFDASLVQLGLPLAHGGSVVLLDVHERLHPKSAWRCLLDAEVTVLDCAPSWLLMMLEHAPRDLPLRRIVLGGEALTPGLARQVRERFPQALLVNIYGPTEACVDATSHTLQPQDFLAERIPIGTALPGYRLHVLGPDLVPVAPGEVGELWIGGVGLAEGYWGRPELSAQRFVEGLLVPGERLYQTGDLVREVHAGCLEFRGRADQQVKIRGQRVELGEVEAVLAGLPGVQAAVVLARPEGPEARLQLVAYVVPEPGVELPLPSELQWRAGLQALLPAHMRPSAYVVLNELPVTPTGKVDRHALPAPQAPTRPLLADELPRTPLEWELVHVWQALLGIGPFSVRDNFFELGGDSLSAVRLLVQIEARWGQALTLQTLLAHPSVADLAVAMERDSAGAAPSLALPLSTQPSTVAPWFVVPPVAGLGLVYAGLARALAGCVPVVALQAVGLPVAGVGRWSMAALTSWFADEIERRQPHGALRLGGYSAGGAVVHALADQLLQRGRVVSVVVLLDPYGADGSDSTDDPRHQPQGEAAFWRVCGYMVWEALGLCDSAADPLLAATRALWAQTWAQGEWQEQAPAVQAALRELRAVLPERMALPVYRLLLEGLANLWHAYSGYAPHPLGGVHAVYMVQPEADAPALRQWRAARWQQHFEASRFTVCTVPGDHGSLLNRAHSVEAIAACLQQALGRPGGSA